MVDKTQALINLHDALIKLQRKRRFIALRFGIPSDQAGESLGFTEEAILIVLNAEPEKNVKELAETLHLERSWMSRVISALESKGLVESFVPEADRRSKKLNITPEGRAKLQALHLVSRKIMDTCLDGMPQAAMEALYIYLKRFADGLNTSSYPQTTNNHPVEVELARVSRAMGILSDDVMGSSLSVTQLQVLLVLSEADGTEVVTSDIDELLPFDMSTVSRTIAGFEKQNLVQKVQSETDKRSYMIHLTDAGRARVAAYKEMALAIFARAVAGCSVEDVHQFTHIVQNVTGDMPQLSQRSLRDHIEVKAIGSEPVKAAKENYDDMVIRDEQTGSELTAQFGVFQNGQLKGTSEITRSTLNGGISKLSISGEALNNKLAMVLLRSSLERTAS
jgi:DNA-binding MarR family transcriptional regulator